MIVPSSYNSPPLVNTIVPSSAISAPLLITIVPSSATSAENGTTVTSQANARICFPCIPDIVIGRVDEANEFTLSFRAGKSVVT